MPPRCQIVRDLNVERSRRRQFRKPSQAAFASLCRAQIGQFGSVTDDSRLAGNAQNGYVCGAPPPLIVTMRDYDSRPQRSERRFRAQSSLSAKAHG